MCFISAPKFVVNTGSSAPGYFWYISRLLLTFLLLLCLILNFLENFSSSFQANPATKDGLCRDSNVDRQSIKASMLSGLNNVNLNNYVSRP